jgi:hypothetical protein
MGELKKRTQKIESNLTPQEKWIIDQTLKTWNLDLFTEYFFRLPISGTRWMPGDSIGTIGTSSTTTCYTAAGPKP